MRTFCLVLGMSASLMAPSMVDAGADPASSEIVLSAEEYRARLQELLALCEKSARSAEQHFEQRRSLYPSGLVARQELEASRRVLEEAQARVESTHSQVIAVNKLIAEVRLADELEKGREREPLIKDAVIFYSGTAPWSLADTARIEIFYITRFGVSLPVSAIGQTELHTRMGFNHREAVDVAIHPDSPEGIDLMEFLRASGLSFIAFRQALPGSATGAHIHVGRPSVKAAVRNGSNPNTGEKAGS